MTLRRSRSRVARALLLLVALLAGCASSADTDQEVVVLAASSLRPALDDIFARYEAQTGTSVVVTYAGSQTLAAQIEEGFPADLFVSANNRHIERLTAAELVTGPVVIATNTLAVLVDDAAGAAGPIEALTTGEPVVIVADPAVPLGEYTAQWLQSIGRSVDELRPVSLEASAQAVAAKILAGEADAAIGYGSYANLEGLATIAIDGPVVEYTAVIVNESAAGSDLLDHLVARADSFADSGFGRP